MLSVVNRALRLGVKLKSRGLYRTPLRRTDIVLRKIREIPAAPTQANSSLVGRKSVNQGSRFKGLSSEDTVLFQGDSCVRDQLRGASKRSCGPKMD